MDVFAAVSILISEKPPSFPLEREFAAATFAGWINWPKEPFAGDNLTLVALMQDVAKSRLSGQPIDFGWFAEVFDPEIYLRQITCDGIICMPEFYDVDDSEGYFDETRYVADIVRFLLSYRSLKADKRFGPSLGKACEFINKHAGFPGGKKIKKRSLEYSNAQHQEVWRTYKKTCAFQFVRYYDSHIDWLVDPRRASFLDELSNIANNCESLQRYFSKVSWVQHRLEAIIDRRSMTTSDYFPFPDSVRPERCRVPAMPKIAYVSLAKYRRNRSTDFDD